MVMNTPVVPGSGSLGLTGSAPSLTQGPHVRLEVGFIALAGPAPTVTRLAGFIELGTGAIALVGAPPTVAVSNAPFPGAGILTLAGLLPTLIQTTLGDPLPGILSLVGSAPTITSSINGLVLPGAGILTLTGPAPGISVTSGARFVDPGPGVLQILGFIPRITQSANGVIPGTPQDYSSLITSEHRDKPRFKAVVELLVSGLTDGMRALLSMPVLYQFDNALGEQLDRVGAWVGLTRFVLVPSLGTVELSDADYRLLLISKIAANHFDGSFEQYQQILSSLFVGYGFQMIAVDNQDMSLDIYVTGATPTPLQLALMQGGHLPPKPEGVRINSVTVVGANPVFGTDQDNSIISGPDVGAFF